LQHFSWKRSCTDQMQKTQEIIRVPGPMSPSASKEKKVLKVINPHTMVLDRN